MMGNKFLKDSGVSIRDFLFVVVCLSFFSGCNLELEMPGDPVKLQKPAINTDFFKGAQTVENISDRNARITWVQVSEAAKYEIYITSPVNSLVGSVDKNSSFLIVGLLPSTTYSAKVRAINRQGQYDLNDKNIIFTTLPSSPSGLTLASPASSPDQDTTPTIEVSGISSGQTVRIFTDSNCSTQVGSGVAGATPIQITTSALSVGNHRFYADVTDSNLQTSACSSAFVDYRVAITCPSGYLPVPENSGLGVNEFCVMRFEAKNVGGNPTSAPGGTPWVYISTVDAKAECLSLGAGYDLISNPEWMTIAREIENTPSNWSGNAVGSGSLNRGHGDANPNSMLAVSNVNDPYNGTNNNAGQPVRRGWGAEGGGWEQRRTHTLSNGTTLWDFGGNASESVDWTLGGVLDFGPQTCSYPGANWGRDPYVFVCGELVDDDYRPANPSNQPLPGYNSDDRRFGEIVGALNGGARRGGTYNGGDTTGVFGLHFSSRGSSSSGGFRCVYRM